MMRRRKFLSCSMAVFVPGTTLGSDTLPPARSIHDREGESTLLPAHGAGPLVYVSHRLGGIPAKGRQREAPWVMFDAMRRAGWHLVRSADAGPDTYGNDLALSYCARMCSKAIQRVEWNGQLFALGISMGALPALQMTWKGLFPQPVVAVATIDGAMNLQAIHSSPPERRKRIEAAYAEEDEGSFRKASRGHDPLNDFHDFSDRSIPLLALASSDDAVLPIAEHSTLMVAASRSIGGKSEIVRTKGPHLADSHFSEDASKLIIEFFSKHAHGL